MTTVVTGCPKSGTHAVCALLDRLGLRRVPGTILGSTADQAPHIAGVNSLSIGSLRMLPDSVYALGHVCAEHADVLEGMAVLAIIRDPRNVLISYQRHRHREGVELTTAEALADFWGAPFVPTYRGYLGWRGKAAVLRYEDLPSHIVGDGYGIYCVHDRHHNTRTGFPSEFAEYWEAADYHAWREADGPTILAEAGYAQ